MFVCVCVSIYIYIYIYINSTTSKRHVKIFYFNWKNKIFTEIKLTILMAKVFKKKPISLMAKAFEKKSWVQWNKTLDFKKKPISTMAKAVEKRLKVRWQKAFKKSQSVWWKKTFNEKAHQYEEKHLRKTHHSDGKRF